VHLQRLDLKIPSFFRTSPPRCDSNVTEGTSKTMILVGILATHESVPISEVAQNLGDWAEFAKFTPYMASTIAY